MKFATLYNKVMVDRRHTFQSHPEGESLTQQSDADDADINVIMARYQKTGMMPGIQETPLQGDFSSGEDFRALQDKLLAAREAFGEIPAEIRKRFNNDPAQFVDFVQNPENADELVKMGLANAPSPKEEYDAQETRKNAQKRYDDDGEFIPSPDSRSRGIDPDGGSRQSSGEGRPAVRQPQGVQQAGAREPGRGGPSGSGR